MKTSSIRVEGNIISPELFERLDTNEILGQSSSDFGFERSIKVKDEIARAWADAKDQWNIFQRRIEKLSDIQSGVEETRKYWILPLLENLGYRPEFQRAAEIVNGNSYSISHRDTNIDTFPIHLMGLNDNLDKKRESGGPRMSPHALLQEYLNVTEHLYGIVSNGIFLRILRDSGKLVRLSYLEFNLQRMLEDDLYAEFSIMYRLIHSSRMPKKQAEAEQCIFEQYHQDAIESGSRIREKLSSAVEVSIKTIANGFLSHPANDQLRNDIKEGKLKPEVYFQQLLRFIYRILFLLVIEERDILYPEFKKESTQEEKEKLLYLKNIYYNNYSVSRLRKLADKIYFFDDKLEDLWLSLRNTFNIFIEERYAQKLGLYPLGGDLFSQDSIGVLSESQLNNKVLLECIRNLSLFENPNGKDIIRVNYAALNVEEFGSVYEGLLEYDGVFNINGNITFEFVKSSERSSSGSHYTPEELVQPLIKHSLDYVIEDKLKSAASAGVGAKEKALLSIKTCDVACGSGHILLSAARRIAIELARVKTGEDQPSPEPYRQALRDVINHCIYGVDKNPLAVELCKVALWLEAYNPGMPLSFLDHKIKCGDSIVGLARREELERGIANEAFKKLPGDEAEVVKYLIKKNKDESQGAQNIFDANELLININQISTKYKDFDLLPELTISQVKEKAQNYNTLKNDDWWRLKKAADVQVAQFFISKIKENQKYLTTFADYFRILNGEIAKHELQNSFAMAVGVEKKFFHWFLEFPDIFAEGGFDCIIGNPPFLGARNIAISHGYNYSAIIKYCFPSTKGNTDLVGYFFLRGYTVIKDSSYLAFISTNTICQGDTRVASLEEILKLSGKIIYAIKSIKWPGKAAVVVSLLSICKGLFSKQCFLNNQKVMYIDSFLSETEVANDPHPLFENLNKSFKGSEPAQGFMLEINRANEFLKTKTNHDVISPYLCGDDLNSEFNQLPTRYVINFFDWDIEQVKKYPDVFNKIEASVKPIWLLNADKSNTKNWWWHRRRSEKLYETIQDKVFCFACGFTSKYAKFSIVKVNQVFSNSVVVICQDELAIFSILNSCFHEYWSIRYCSTMGESTIRYTPSASFESFPFPKELMEKTNHILESIGGIYHEHRSLIMRKYEFGLTKTYNIYHTTKLLEEDVHSIKISPLQPFDQLISDIETLRQLHKQMDEAVLKAYGWTDINLAHDFYEVDYLPENDRIRYTISPEARKEILKRLLELNYKIHAEEVAAGLWDKKGKKKEKVTQQIAANEDQLELF